MRSHYLINVFVSIFIVNGGGNSSFGINGINGIKYYDHLPL